MDKANLNLQITPEQANVLLQLLDTACKAGGLAVAQPALFFHDLIKRAHGASQYPPETTPPPNT